MIKYRAIVLVCLLFPSCQLNDVEDLKFEYNGSYVALGDSVTYGKGSESLTSWADIVKANIGVCSYEKKAVSGAVASHRYPGEKYDLLSQVLQLKGSYDLITLMIGINDCLLGYNIGNVEEEIRLSLEELDYKLSFTQGFIYNIKLLQNTSPEATLIVVAPPPITYQTGRDLSEYVEAERRVCSSLSIPFIDMYGSLYDPNDQNLCVDRIHPTDKGYRLIAQHVLPRIIDILGL